MSVRRSRWWFLLLALAAAVAHAQTLEVDVSGRIVKIPTSPDLVRVREVDPETFRLMDFSTPPLKRLVEILMSDRDLARANAGQLSEGATFIVYEELRWQGREPTAEEWGALRASMRRIAVQADLSTLGDAVETELNNASDQKLQGQLRFQIAEIGKPVVYRDDDESFRMHARISGAARTDRAKVSMDMVLFTAHLTLNGRLMFFNGACLCAEDAERVEALRVAFDEMVDRAIAENRPAVSVP